MAYFILTAGFMICLYSLIIIRKNLNGVQSFDGTFLQDEELFNNNLEENIQNAAGAGMLYELKERVDAQLAEVNKQKEIAAYLMMRVEKNLNVDNNELLTTAANKDIKKNTGASEERLQLFNSVYTLHDQGVSIAEIAKKMQKGKGEIELILGLRG